MKVSRSGRMSSAGVFMERVEFVTLMAQATSVFLVKVSNTEKVKNILN